MSKISLKGSLQVPLSPMEQIASFVRRTVQNPNESLFADMNDKEKQQMWIIKKPEPANVWHFCLKKENQSQK